MGPDSDVDLFIDFDPKAPITLFDLMDLESFLADRVGRKVDLMTRGGLHPRLKAHIEASSIRVY